MRELEELINGLEIDGTHYDEFDYCNDVYDVREVLDKLNRSREFQYLNEHGQSTYDWKEASVVVTAAAMRGKNEDGSWKQQIEVSNREEANALTTVQKDSLVAKGVVIYDDYDNRIKSDRSVIRTLTTNIGNDASRNGTKLIQQLPSGLKIRKLTPKECFRLMGFDDKDCDVLIENGISNTQLYKMAGNSICVDVLEELFIELLNQYNNLKENKNEI